MITDVSLPEGAFSLCWGCANYEWSIILDVKNKWEHFCGKGFQAGDEVKQCEGHAK